MAQYDTIWDNDDDDYRYSLICCYSVLEVSVLYTDYTRYNDRERGNTGWGGEGRDDTI